MPLIKSKMQPPAQPGPEEMNEPGEGTPGEEQEDAAQGEAPQGASQQVYERVVMAASKVLHDPKRMQAIIQMVKAHGNPVAGLADATIFVMQMLFQISKGSIPQEVIVPAGQEVLQMIAEMCERAGILKVTPELLKQAAGVAAAKVLKQNGIDQAKAQQLASQGGGAQQQPTFKPAFTGGG